MAKSDYDLVIIGMGPAGYTASIYASRYKVKNLIIGKLMGGLIGESAKVCNYPSENEISGLELMAKMQAHAVQLGGDEMFDHVKNIEKLADGTIKLTTEQNGEVITKSVILATGLKHRMLNVPGEHELTGRGVAYCATCDGFFYRNKTVAVIGGSDSATSAAVYLGSIAEKVYLIYRGSELRGEVAWIDLVKNNPKIKVILNANVVKIGGEGKVSDLELDKPYFGKNKIEVSGVFIEVGAAPNPEFSNQLGLKTNEAGYIRVDEAQATSVPGVYAAGDVTTASNQFKQVITACSEGAIAAQSVFSYLSTRKEKPTKIQAKMLKVK